MPEADTKERKKLIVKSVGNVGGKAENPVVSFSASTEGDDGVWGFEVWGKELVEVIKPDAHLDCEITYKKKGDDLINRVTQIWDSSGNPLRKSTRRSNTQNMQEVAESFERGAAMIGGAVLVAAGILPGDGPLAKKVVKFIEDNLSVPASKKTEVPAGNKQQPESSAGSQVKEKPLSQDELQSIHDEVKEAGYTNDTFRPLLKEHGADKISSLTRANAEKLLKDVRAGKGLPKKG